MADDRPDSAPVPEPAPATPITPVIPAAGLKMRLAGADDFDLLVGFVKAMAVDSEGVALDDATVAAGVRGMLETPAMGGYLLAESGGEAVGSLMMQYEWSDWRARRVIWIHSVYVRPEWRRRGVWRAMYEHLRRRVETDPGLAGLRLYVDKTNARAIAGYQAVGMSDAHYHLYEWMDPAGEPPRDRPFHGDEQ